MKHSAIITIGRQFGSGGREIGKLLADRLGVQCYDRELITLASEESGYNQEVLEGADEKQANVFMQSFAITQFAVGSRISLPTEISINDKLFFAQANVIQKLADKGPCVIVGRCADYILRDHKNCFHVFIHAPLEKRIARVASLYGLNSEDARNTIIKTDKKRANYYNYYSNKVWDNVESYDLSIDSCILGAQGTVDVILKFAEQMRASTK